MYFKDEGAGEEEDTLHVSALGHVYKQTKRFFFVCTTVVFAVFWRGRLSAATTTTSAANLTRAACS